MGCSETSISRTECYDRPFWSFIGSRIYSMGPCEVVTHSWVCFRGLTGDVSPVLGATHQDTERALFHISEEGEQENDGTEET